MNPYTFLVDTYATERLKTLGVWAHFADADLSFRPEPRARTPLEHMVHQCVSEDTWMQRMLGIARVMKLDAFVKPLGMAEPQFAKCLTDQAAVARIEASNNKAVQDYGVDGTPSFLINGKRVDKAYDWEKLEPQLKAAL